MLIMTQLITRRTAEPNENAIIVACEPVYKLTTPDATMIVMNETRHWYFASFALINEKLTIELKHIAYMKTCAESNASDRKT